MSDSNIVGDVIRAFGMSEYHYTAVRQEITENQQNIFTAVIWWRRSVMTISSILLISNIVLIIKNCEEKQYLYNTLKIFLFLELFSLLGQLFVLPHNQAFQNGKFSFPTDNSAFEQSESEGTLPDQINNLINSMIQQSGPMSMLPCALEAYINLICYNVSYLFALLITLYVRKVLDNDYKFFIFKQRKLIALTVTIMAVVYAVPFVLTFFVDAAYSFGPTGFEIYDSVFSGSSRYYLFYCGITTRANQTYAGVVSGLNMALIPIGMFFLHSYILHKNSQSIKFLRGLEELNPRQWFILQSGNLSFFIFVVQSVNFIKYILSIVGTTFLIIPIGILNMIFDFFPIILVILYYRKYYKKGVKLQNDSLVRNEDSSSIVTNDVIR